MVFYKAFNNLSAISPDHLSVSSRHTRAFNDNKFMSLPVRTDVFKYSFFPRTITDWNSLPLAVRLSQSTQSFHGALLNHPPTVADHHDTPAVTGGLHPLLDISPKNTSWLDSTLIFNIKNSKTESIFYVFVVLSCVRTQLSDKWPFSLSVCPFVYHVLVLCQN